MSSVRDALPDGRLATLLAMRDALASSIDVCDSHRDLPALTRQLGAILAEIESLAPPVGEGDAVDEIAKRRAARRAGAAKGSSRTKRSS